MRESAMMRKIGYAALQLPEDVEIGRFSGQRHSRGRERSFSVASGSAQHRAGEKMSDRFQVTFVAQMRSVDLRVARRGFARRTLKTVERASLRRATDDVGRTTDHRSSDGCPFGTSTVSESGTTDNVIGRRPSNSPSAST